MSAKGSQLLAPRVVLPCLCGLRSRGVLLGSPEGVWVIAWNVTSAPGDGMVCATGSGVGGMRPTGVESADVHLMAAGPSPRLIEITGDRDGRF